MHHVVGPEHPEREILANVGITIAVWSQMNPTHLHIALLLDSFVDIPQVPNKFVAIYHPERVKTGTDLMCLDRGLTLSLSDR